MGKTAIILVLMFNSSTVFAAVSRLYLCSFGFHLTPCSLLSVGFAVCRWVAL